MVAMTKHSELENLQKRAEIQRFFGMKSALLNMFHYPG
jgi:hypothetical protein